MENNLIEYMKEALEVAKNSKHEDGRVHPLVGAVIVTKEGKIVSAHRGKHSEGAHAEYSALEELNAGEAAGATVFATLEPCTVRPRKIPCAEHLIAHKVGKVYVAMLDPNPAICGRGIRQLRKHGIDVQLFPRELSDRVESMNLNFIRHFEAMSPLDSVSQEVVSLVNPRYDQDLSALDGEWKHNAIITSETILIVTADTFIGELLDRPTAARIRDAVDRCGSGNRYHRAILMGHAAWKKAKFHLQCPTISIGGEEINPATKEIRQTARVTSKQEFSLSSGKAVFVNDGAPRVAIWGLRAADTHAAAVEYISASQGLAEFLSISWKKPVPNS